MRQHAAEQHANHEPGRPRAAPHRQRTVALAAFGKRGIHQRQRGGKDKRPTETLGRAGGEKDLGYRSEPAGQRGTEVQHEPRYKDPAAAEQVGGATTKQQESGGRYRISADHRLQRLRRIAQIAADLGQRESAHELP
jgi:hypothetical protein